MIAPCRNGEAPPFFVPVLKIKESCDKFFDPMSPSVVVGGFIIIVERGDSEDRRQQLAS